jgi:hypothetical protein
MQINTVVMEMTPFEKFARHICKSCMQFFITLLDIYRNCMQTSRMMNEDRVALAGNGFSICPLHLLASAMSLSAGYDLVEDITASLYHRIITYTVVCES